MIRSVALLALAAAMALPALAQDMSFTAQARGRAPGPVLALAISADESLVAAAGAGEDEATRVTLFDRRTMKPLGGIMAQVGAAPQLAFAPGAELLLIHGSAALELWEVPVAPLDPAEPLDARYRRWRQPVDAPGVTHATIGAPPHTVTWSSGEALFRRNTERGSAAPADPLWQAAEGTPTPGVFAPAPDGTRLALLREGEKTIGMVQQGRPGIARVLTGHRFPVTAAGYDAAGQLLSIDTGHTLVQWPAGAGSPRTTFLQALPEKLALRDMLHLAGQAWLLLPATPGETAWLLDAAQGQVVSVPLSAGADSIAASPTGHYVALGEGTVVRLLRFGAPMAPLEYVRQLRQQGAFQTARNYVDYLEAEGLDPSTRDALARELKALPSDGLGEAEMRDRLRAALGEHDAEAVRFWAGKLLALRTDDAEALAALAQLKSDADRGVLDRAEQAMSRGQYRIALNLLTQELAPDSPLFDEAETLIQRAEVARRIQTALEQAQEKMNLGNYVAAEAIVGQVLRDDPEHPAALALLEEIEDRDGRILGFRPVWLLALLALVVLIAAAMTSRQTLMRRWREPRAPRGGPAPDNGSAAGTRGPGAKPGPEARPRRTRAEQRHAVEQLLEKTEEMVRLFRQADSQGRHTTMLLEYEAELHSLHRRVMDRTGDLDAMELRLKQMQSHLRRVQFQGQSQGQGQQAGQQRQQEHAGQDHSQQEQTRQQHSQQGQRQEAPPRQPPPAGDPEDELTYYELLRVPSDAAPAVIKAAYHQRLKEYHPDLHSSSDFDWIKSEAERMSRKIGEAYAVLGDPARRTRYDNDLRRRGRRSS